MPADESSLAIVPNGNGAIPMDPDFLSAPNYYNFEMTAYSWIDIEKTAGQVALSDWVHPGNTWASDDGFYTVDLDFEITVSSAERVRVQAAQRVASLGADP